MCAPKRLENAPAESWRTWLGANAPRLGVKAQELQWTGVLDWLALQSAQRQRLNQSQVVGYARANGVHVSEVIYAETAPQALDEIPSRDADTGEWIVREQATEKEVERFDRLTEALGYIRENNAPAAGIVSYEAHKPEGGTNYRELLLTLPVTVNTTGWSTMAYRKDAWRVFDEKGDVVGNFPADSEAEALVLAREYRERAPEQRRGRDYVSSHWSDVPNVLVHARVDDRVDADGRRVLMVHEIQSDWAADLKEKPLAQDRDTLLAQLQANADASAANGDVAHSESRLFTDARRQAVGLPPLTGKEFADLNMSLTQSERGVGAARRPGDAHP